MARKPNYQFERMERDRQKAAKAAEKAAEKARAKEAQAGETSPEFFYNTALLLHRTGQLEDAEALYRRAVA